MPGGPKLVDPDRVGKDYQAEELSIVYGRGVWSGVPTVMEFLFVFLLAYFEIGPKYIKKGIDYAATHYDAPDDHTRIDQGGYPIQGQHVAYFLVGMAAGMHVWSAVKHVMFRRAGFLQPSKFARQASLQAGERQPLMGENVSRAQVDTTSNFCCGIWVDFLARFLFDVLVFVGIAYMMAAEATVTIGIDMASRLDPPPDLPFEKVDPEAHKAVLKQMPLIWLSQMMGYIVLRMRFQSGVVGTFKVDQGEDRFMRLLFGNQEIKDMGWVKAATYRVVHAVNVVNRFPHRILGTTGRRRLKDPVTHVEDDQPQRSPRVL